MVDIYIEPEIVEKTTRLRKRQLKIDLKEAQILVTTHQVRFLVDTYYLVQNQRIRANNQISALSKANEPTSLLAMNHEEMKMFERSIKTQLEVFVEQQELGRKVLGVYGIGPVLTAGLMANIKIERAPTVGHIWRYAGLDPTVRWDKGQKRPWNASLKRVCWLIGESFKKFHNRPDCFYGKLYEQRKALEVERNEQLLFKDQAEETLRTKKIGKDTEAYAYYISGKLPPARIDMRAMRWSVKLFLAHYHDCAFWIEYKTAPPKPYVISHLGHAHMIVRPW